jgi:hypothetical protein
MQTTGSFSVPLRRERKDDRDDHGTEVTVRRLKPELRDAWRCRQHLAEFRCRVT